MMTPKEIVRRAGGPKAVAAKLGISQPAVSQWRDEIPIEHVKVLADMSGISPAEIRPDIAALFVENKHNLIDGKIHSPDGGLTNE